MRKAVGPDFDLMIDAHTWWRMGDRSYSAETVDQMARDLAGTAARSLKHGPLLRSGLTETFASEPRIGAD